MEMFDYTQIKKKHKEIITCLLFMFARRSYD